MDEEETKEKANENFEKKREEMRKKDEEKTEKNWKRREKNRKKKSGKADVNGGDQHGKASDKANDGPAFPKKDAETDGDELPAITVEDVGVIIHENN